jgi:gliding motility-associated-like protein
MPKLLRLSFFWLVVLCISVLYAVEAVAQTSCGSTTGAPQPDGGPQKEDNGTLCLNSPVQSPAIISFSAKNVIDNNDRNNFGFVIDWDDGSPLQIVSWGGPIPMTYDPIKKEYAVAAISHVFLPKNCSAPMGRQCSYTPRTYLRIAGQMCSAVFGSPPDFFRYNTDDQCSGNMLLSETVTGAAVFDVCAGASTTVTFTDRTRLNCLPPEELTGLNATNRWRQFVYGTTNTITGTVMIGGTPRVFPYNPTPGSPTVSPGSLTISSPPYANNNTMTITIPATAKVGEEFHIRMDYWNFCNKFTDGAPAVFREGIIRVVDQPVAPTANSQVVCNGTSPLPNFSINFATPSSAVLWYRDNANSPGAAVTNPNGGNNKTFPSGSFPGGISNTTAGVYRMWASYRAQVGAGSLYCESVPVPVTITVRESIPTPGPISGTANVCNGSTGVNYGLPVPANNFPFGGPNEYVWEVLDATNTPVSDITLTPTSGTGATAQNVSVDFNVANGTFGGGPSVTRKLRVRRRYTTASTFPAPGSQCETNFAEFTITVFRNTNAGTVTGGDTQCEGNILAPINWNPGVGNIVRWEVSVNGGGFNPVAAFGTGNPVDPTTLSLAVIGGLPTTYTYRAQIQNGACAMLASPTVSYVINPNSDVASAGPDQDLCQPIAALQATLAANTPASGAVTRSWSQVSGPSTVVFGNASIANTTATVTVPGTYVFRWTLDNGTCQSIDDVQVRYGSTPNAPVPTAADVCSKTGVLSGTAPMFETVTWSQVSGPGTATFGDASNINTSVTVDTYGAYVFNLRFSSGGCIPPKDQTVGMTFFAPALSTPEADRTVCVDGNGPGPIAPFAITGTVGGGSTGGHWEIQTGSGTFMSNNNAIGMTITPAGVIGDSYLPSVADFNAGTVTLRLVAEHNAPCTPVSNTVVYTFDKKPPNAAVAANIQVCGTSATLNGIDPTPTGIGTWSVITAGPTITDVTDRLSPVDNLQFGPNVFRWEVNSVGGTCPATTADFTITRTTAPAIVDLTPDDLCETNPNTGVAQGVDLTTYDDQVKGGVIPTVKVEWFTNPARTTLVAAPTNEAVSNGSVYYTRVSTLTPPACSSDGIVTFTINPKPFIGNLDLSRCEDTFGSGAISNIDLTSFDDDVALNVGNRIVSWYSDAALTTSVATPTDVDGIVDNTTFYARVENTVTNCFNVAEVNFKVTPIPDANPIDGPDKVCLDPANVVFYKVHTLRGANYTYQWNIPATATVVGPTNDFYVLLQFPAVVPGGLTISVQETSPDGCPGLLQTKDIIIEDKPQGLTVDIVPSGTKVCENGTADFIAPLFPNITYSWDVPVGASVILGQGTNAVRVNFGTTSGDVTVTPSTSVGCVGAPASLNVPINRIPVFGTLPKTVCSGEPSGITLTTAPLSEPAVSYDYVARVLDANLFDLSTPTDPIATAQADNVIALDEFENKTGGPLNVRYGFVPISAAGCEGSTGFVTLKVNAEPQLDFLSASICSGDATEITLRPGVGSAFADQYIIQSYDNQNPLLLTSVNPTPPTGTPLGDMAIFNDKWVNADIDKLTIKYLISPRASGTGCEGEVQPISVEVFPNPTITAPVAGVDICSGTTLNQPVTTSVAGATTTWSVSQVVGNVLGATSGSGTTITDQLTLTGTGIGKVTYSIQATNPTALGLCEGPVQLFTVTVYPKPVINNPLTPVSCSDAALGNTVTRSLVSLESLVSTSPGASFEWYTDAALTSQITGANLTAYTLQDQTPIYVKVIDNSGLGCSDSAPFQYTVNTTPRVLLAPPVAGQFNSFDVDCFGAATGSLKAEIDPACTTCPNSSDYTYTLNNGLSALGVGRTYLFQSLKADQDLTTPGVYDQYVVTVKDKNGCTATASSTLTEPPLLQSFLANVSDISCFSVNDGKLKATATGGVAAGAYTYTLVPLGVQNATGDFSGLGPGTFISRVTDINGCTAESGQATLAPVTQLQILPMVKEYAPGFNLNCPNGSEGEITATFSGGTPLDATPTYYLTLTKAGDPTVPTPIQTSSPYTFTGLDAGTYTITITDKNLCTRGVTAVINRMDKVSPGSVGVDQAVCDGDDPLVLTELVAPFGGTGVYDYEWEQSDRLPTDGPPDPNNPSQWSTVGTGSTYDPPATLDFLTIHYFRRKVRNHSTLPAPAVCEWAMSSPVRVIVNERPTVTLGGNPTICDGDDLVRTVTLDGASPFEYGYNDGTSTTLGLYGNQTATITIPKVHDPVTITVVNVKDANGCVPVSYPAPMTVEVLKVKADFTILAPDTQCSGGTFTFQWMREPGVTYTWQFSYGADRTIAALDPTDPPRLDTVQHVFRAGSTDNKTPFPVTLTATTLLCHAQGTQSVNVLPSIALNISPGDPMLCSGETFRLKDRSLGVDLGKWYYHKVGDPQQLDVRTVMNPVTTPTPLDILFTMTNTDPADPNPLEYEIVYEASNDELCTAEYRTTVKVYRGVDASFTRIPHPTSPLTGGVSTVQVTNTSSPNSADFSYTWDFGDTRALPADTVIVGADLVPHAIDYFSPGVKNIKLTALNIKALQEENKTCSSTFMDTAKVNLGNFHAAFKATPLAACFPVDIQVDNLSVGADTFNWELYDGTGLVSTSTLAEPTFRILKPGKYDIYLTATFHTDPNNPAFAVQKGIEVYDVPSALFQLRPNPLYVPDTEMQTFNQSLRASQYEWDFNDGDKSNEFQPKHLYKLEGKYIVTLIAGYDNGNKDIDGDGILDGNVICYDTAQQEIAALDGGFIKLPNAFTPSANGSSGGVPGNGTFNDVFLPITRGVQEFAMQIFDRWGNLIFESKDKNIGWDGYDKNGRLMPAGVYVYKLVLRLSDGQRTTKLGDVTLIR